MTITRPSRSAPTKGHHSGLRTNALGFPTLLAQSVALISPTMTAVLIIPLAFASAGQSTWLAYAFGTVMLMFVVFCLNQFAKRSEAGGTMYAYTGRGLGPTTGVFSGWTLIWSYMFIAIAGLCGCAVFCGQLLSALGFHGSIHPIVFFAISALACWFIAYKDIRVSSILTLVLEGLSVGCILSLGAVVLFKHGFHLDTDQTSLKGIQLRGMGLAIVACIFSLVGFESATAVSSEAKNPRRNVPRAVIVSLIITGAFMVVMSYIEIAGTRHYATPFSSIGAPLNVLAQLYGVSYFKIPISIGAMVSFFSLSLSCLNAGARIIYPMARHGIFSGHLGRAHATNRTPHVAITCYLMVIFTIPAVLSAFTNPITAFGDAGTLAAFGFLLAYYLITVAAPKYLKKAWELKPHHLVLSGIAVLCLLVPTVGSFYPLPPYPVVLFPYIFLAWMLLGAGWLVLVNRRRPGILAEIESDLERTLEPPAGPIEIPADDMASVLPIAQVEPVEAEMAEPLV